MFYPSQNRKYKKENIRLLKTPSTTHFPGNFWLASISDLIVSILQNRTGGPPITLWVLFNKLKLDKVIPPGFPGGSALKNPPANGGNLNSILGSWSPPREANGNPLQYFCLGNPVNRGTWWASVRRITKESDTT